jgi:sialic acid synthase SpsE
MNASFPANRVIKVKDRLIGPGQPIFLTAEIGLAHMGDFEDAKNMIKAAADAGCDGADMFMASGEDFYHAPFGPGDQNDSRKVWAEQSFSMDQWRELLDYADELGIVLYPTPLDPVSMRHAAELGVPMINLNSDDINNILMLKEAAGLGIPITFHDINASLAEAEAAVRTLIDHGARDLIILHSTQETGEEDILYTSANLRVIDTYRSAFGGMGVLTGCVEHTTSDFLIYAVAALQPVLISKHIQVSKEKNVHDTNISVEIDALSTMVKKVRYVEMALGSGINQKVVGQDGKLSHGARARRKVLVAARDIPAGKVIDEYDIIAKRPGHLGGLHPWQSEVLIGAKAKADIAYNQILNLNLFEDYQQAAYKFPDIEAVKVESVEKVQGA